MRQRLNIEKAIQAVGVLLRREPSNRMTRLRLLKLLYMADRENLRAAGRPIIGARAVAMRNGPLHSEVYDLIKGQHIGEPRWSHYFRNESRDVVMRDEPEVSELSTREIQTLQAVAEKVEHLDDWDVVELTHEFPEWKDAGCEESSVTIPLEAIATAVGRDPAAVEDDLDAEVELDELLRQVQQA